MKTLGNKSLAAALSRVINIFWWLEWAGFTIIMALGFALAIEKRAFTIDIPITYSAITLKQISSANKDFPSGLLNSTNGNLNLNIHATWQNILLLQTGLSILCAAAILITYQLRCIFASFRQTLPFQGSNITRIRNIAFILIALTVVQWLFVIIVNQVLFSNLIWEQVQLTYHFNFSALITGLILIVVAEIFKLGVSLENENKLTI